MHWLEKQGVYLELLHASYLSAVETCQSTFFSYLYQLNVMFLKHKMYMPVNIHNKQPNDMYAAKWVMWPQPFLSSNKLGDWLKISIISPLKSVWPFIWTNLNSLQRKCFKPIWLNKIPFTQRILLSNLVEIGRVVLDKEDENVKS